MKTIIFIILLSLSLFAETQKVYLYTTQSNVKNFKSLKVDFDAYLQQYGQYEFQAFSDKKSFESHLKNNNTIVMLSSWHYQEIAKQYNMQAKFIAQNRDTITDFKILVGKKDEIIKGVVASAYDAKYTTTLLNMLVQDVRLHVVKVPKEIDALMSVGFGMSQFALVSHDTLKLLQEVNGFLAKDLKIYKKSKKSYRMIIASNYKNDISRLFEKMDKDEKGKKILHLLGIDKLVILKNNTSYKIGDVE